MDRKERRQLIQELVTQQRINTQHDLLAMLADDATLQTYLVAVQAYRDKYGIN